MISLDIPIKPSSTIDSIAVAPADKNSKSDSNTLSFSELLKGVTVKKDGNKIVQNGLLVLSLVEKSTELTTNISTKSSNTSLEISDLINNIDKVTQELAPLSLNNKITQAMSIDELKGLIKDAKNYLKKQILQNSDFKKSELVALPKTLKGLMQVAKKFDINLSKITIEEIEASKVLPKTFLKQTKEVIETKIDKTQNTNSLQKQQDTTPIDENIVLDTKKEIKSTSSTVKVKVEDVAKEIKNTPVAQEKKNTPEIVVLEREKISDTSETVDITKETKNRFGLDKNIKVQNSELNQDIASKEIISVKKPTSQENVQSVKNASVQETPEVVQKNEPVTVKQNNNQLSTDIKKIPLFGVQTLTPEITTQQIVNTKMNITNRVTSSKEKLDTTLKILLQGNRAAKKDNNTLSVDFSVATARVIAPSTLKESDKSLESLLGTKAKEEVSIATKTDVTVVNKADSFEVKLNEAKQMIKYISQDVKTAIEDYKSPFTRVKLQLNPQRLGEVDLTIVQRGKNLHINLSSNNVAINTLAANVNDLKVQLNNSGINNATLNFNNNSQGSDSSAQQQQQNHQNQREAQKEYNYFDNQEKNEEVISSLEIVVPNYA